MYMTGIPLEKNMITRKMDIILERFYSCSKLGPPYRISSCFYSTLSVLGSSSSFSSGYFLRWTLWPLSLDLFHRMRTKLSNYQALAIKALRPRVITRILPTSAYQSDSKPKYLFFKSKSFSGENMLCKGVKLIISSTSPVLKNSMVTICLNVVRFYSLIKAFS